MMAVVGERRVGRMADGIARVVDGSEPRYDRSDRVCISDNVPHRYCGLHHSTAGTIEVLLALLAGAGPTWADYGPFISAAAVGNAVGGALFVAVLKFGHVRASA